MQSTDVQQDDSRLEMLKKGGDSALVKACNMLWQAPDRHDFGFFMAS